MFDVRWRDCTTGVGWPFLYTFVLLGIAVSWPAPTKAHDIYGALKDSAGTSCCSERDCRPRALPFDSGRGADAGKRGMDSGAGRDDTVSDPAGRYR